MPKAYREHCPSDGSDSDDGVGNDGLTVNKQQPNINHDHLQQLTE